MIRTTTVSCKYVGSQIRIGKKINKAFNSCTLDENWELKNQNFNSTIKHYKAKNNNAKVILEIHNHPKKDMLHFKKNSNIKLSERVIQYNEKNLMVHYC